MLMRVAADADKNGHEFVKRDGLGSFEVPYLLLTNGRVRHDDHDVGVGGEDVYEGCKVGVPHFHALERRCQFAVKIKKNRIKSGANKKKERKWVM